jgi:hypothetical protein
MRTFALSTLLFLGACGGDEQATLTTDDDRPEPIDDDDDDDTDDEPLVDTTDEPSPDTGSDTGLAALGFDGDATVTPEGWSGTERWHTTALSSGTPLCEWSLITEDWATAGQPSPSPSEGVVCDDGDGTPCAFAFDVVFHSGTDTGAGTRCDAFAMPQQGVVGFGFHEDVRYGGVSYGSALMYFLDVSLVYPSLPADTYFDWVPLQGDAELQGDQFHYALELGTIAYVP